jgi:hypothetical protein
MPVNEDSAKRLTQSPIGRLQEQGEKTTSCPLGEEIPSEQQIDPRTNSPQGSVSKYVKIEAGAHYLG